MGWLRDLVNASDLRVKSLGTLAKLALDQADWPADVRIQPRSLAALLGKIDRGQELGWLAARVGVQIALARVLGLGVDAITRGLRSAEPDAVAESRSIRLRDLPAARPLDLWSEALPPGLPEFAVSPLSPARWWVAPSGAGRTLVGSWLQARGRARFVPPPRAVWDDPEPGAPVFLELDESTELSARVPARPGLIVAAPFAPPADSGFERVSTPSLAASVEALVSWALERLPPDTRLVGERAALWLGERVAEGQVSTFGAALGLLGLADERGARAIEQRSLEQLARRYVEERLLEALDPTLSQSGWLRRHGFDAVVGLVERALVDSDAHPAAARGIDDWLALVPHELERTVDVDWVRLSLKNIDSGVRPSELERAARRLPPGAYRLVTALEQAGFLRRLGDERLKLGPTFLAELLEKKAFLQLSARSPVEWGEALLRPHAASRLADVLLERALSAGASLLEPVLDLTPSDEPEYAVTLDLALRIAGVSRLLGSDVSQETLEGLWNEGRRFFVELEHEAPRPILETMLAADDHGPSRGRQLLQRGTALIAALAITETLGRGGRELAALAPWNATEPPPNTARVYDAIAEALGERPPWYAATLRLVGRLRGLIGNVQGTDTPHELEWPAQFVDEVEHGVLTFAAFERQQPALDAVLALARVRHIAPEKLCEAVWSAWHDAGQPVAARPFSGETPWAEFTFRHAAPHWVERWLASNPAPDALFSWLAPETFRSIARLPEITGRRAALAAMPPEVLDALVHSSETRAALAPAFDLLWSRSPSAAEAAFVEELRVGSAARASVLTALLRSTPAAFVPRAVAALVRDDRAFALPRAALDAVRTALQGWSSSRASGWRDAYAFLRRIERDRHHD